jgi:hypothetical protein
MDDNPEIWPLFAWDGHRLLIVRANGAQTTRWLGIVAHAGLTSRIVATTSATGDTCIAQLPAGCRHIDLFMQDSAGRLSVVSVELDDLLSEGMIDPGLAGVRRIAVSSAPSGPTLDWLNASSPDIIAASLFLPMAALGDQRRCRIGPMSDPQAGQGLTVVSVKQGPDASGILVSLHADGDSMRNVPPVMAAHVIARSTEMHKALKAIDPSVVAGLEEALDGVAAASFPPGQPDATGLDAAMSFRRGFRILQPSPSADGQGAVVAIPQWQEQDEIILFAPRGQRLTRADDETDGAGSRLMIREADGAFVSTVFSRPYRPATSSALATLGSQARGAVAIHFGGTMVAGNLVETAADLVEAFWARHHNPATAGSMSLLERHLTAGTFAPADPAETLSPAIAALGPQHRVSRTALEELDALPVLARIAFLQWFDVEPALAIGALRARVELPIPDAGAKTAQMTDVIAWYANPALPAELNALADRISTMPASEDRRDRLALLRRVTGAVGNEWIDLANVAAAHALMREHMLQGQPPGGEDVWSSLLVRLGRDAELAAHAREEARKLNLETLSQYRAQLPAMAIACGHSQALADDLAQRLPGLSASDVLLLQLHFDGVQEQKRVIRQIQQSIADLDAASAASGFATRFDRSGDPLITITRITASTDQVVRQLLKLPEARKALIALNQWIDVKVPAPPARHAVAVGLRRSLQGYACFHLFHGIVNDCATALTPDDDGAADAELAALRQRLRGGVADTLPQYVGAAAGILGEDFAFGLSFVDRLKAPAPDLAPAQAEAI